ncbi:hypothetical protein EH223_02905 [candidate division KSB1 bacterium]|nr:MAG: hypothetical protein EH223_02905 [candidate division KSB1 bacterium]
MKKTAYLAIIFSLLAHTVALSLLSVIKVMSQQHDQQREIELSVSLPRKDNVPATPTPTMVTNAVAKHKPPKLTEETETAIQQLVKPDSLAADSFGKFDRLAFFAGAPQLTFQQQLEDVKLDTSDTLMINPAVPGRVPFLELKDSIQFSVLPGPYPDRTQRDLEQYNLERPSTVPFNRAITEGADYLSSLFKNKQNKPVRLDFIPSEVELAIFESLWESSIATDQEIYAALDTAIRITAVDLQDVLVRLQQKGLVKRTLVSPRNEFTLPVGTIEMSAKNRRNRVYEYKALIHSDDVLRYLHAVLYEMQYNQKNAPPDSTHTKIINGLKKKILRLVQMDE